MSSTKLQATYKRKPSSLITNTRHRITNKRTSLRIIDLLDQEEYHSCLIPHFNLLLQGLFLYFTVEIAEQKEWSSGIRDLAIHNKNLLMKWHWRYNYEEEALWRKIIEAKHGERRYRCTSISYFSHGIGP